MSYESLIVPMDVHAFCVDKDVISNSDPNSNWQNHQSSLGTTAETLDSPIPKTVLEIQDEMRNYASTKFKNIRNIKNGDAGVYLHWVLPQAMRQSHTTDDIHDTLPMPNRWLVTRFLRDKTTPSNSSVKQWFVDSGHEKTTPAQSVEASLSDTYDLTHSQILMPKTDNTGHEARIFGKVYELKKPPFTPGSSSEIKADDLKNSSANYLDALGNSMREFDMDIRLSAVPSFAAEVSNNRSTLSFHDPLTTHLDENANAKSDFILSYHCIGWYGLASYSPIQSLKNDEKIKNAVEGIASFNWKITNGNTPTDTSNPDTVFHGLSGYINYFDKKTYGGNVIGTPDACSKNGPANNVSPDLTVGVGNNALDALIALAYGHDLGTNIFFDKTIKEVKEAVVKNSSPSWKELETVAYQQLEKLMSGTSGAQEPPREHRIHQSWFNSIPAGHTWQVVKENQKHDDFKLNEFRPKELSDQELSTTKIKLSGFPKEAKLSYLKNNTETQIKIEGGSSIFSVNALNGLKVVTSEGVDSFTLKGYFPADAKKSTFEIPVLQFAHAILAPVIGLANSYGAINKRIPIPVSVSDYSETKGDSLNVKNKISLFITVPSVLNAEIGRYNGDPQHISVKKNITIPKGNDAYGNKSVQIVGSSKNTNKETIVGTESEFDLYTITGEDFNDLYIRVPEKYLKGKSLNSISVPIIVKAAANFYPMESDNTNYWHLSLSYDPPTNMFPAIGYTTASLMSLPNQAVKKYANLGIAVHPSSSFKLLHNSQVAMDEQMEQYSLHRQDLYGLWNIITYNIKNGGTISDLDKSVIENFKKKKALANDLHPKILTNSKQIHTTAMALAALLKVSGNGSLKSMPKPRYWQPNDPVVVLHDKNETFTKYQIGHDASVPCRYWTTNSRNFINSKDSMKWDRTALSLSNTDYINGHKPSDITSKFHQFKTNKDKDALIQFLSIYNGNTDFNTTIEGLLTEAIYLEAFLFKGIESAAASCFKSSLYDDWNNWLKQVDSSLKDSGINDLYLLWKKQPWSPMYLEWEVKWYPFDISKNNKWEFKEYEYQQKSAIVSSEINAPTKFQGRSMLAPISGKHLLKRPFEDALEKMAAVSNPKMANINASYKQLHKGVIHAMTISGFHERLMGRDANLPKVVPGRDTGWLQGDNKSTYEDPTYFAYQPVYLPGPYAGGVMKPKHAKSISYPPMGEHNNSGSLTRSGFMAITRMVLRDDFGQWMDLMEETKNKCFINPHGFTTFSADAKKTIDETTDKYYSHKLDHKILSKSTSYESLVLQMPPRFLQPAQMSMRLKAALDPTKETHPFDGNSNPIMGWIVYNILDNSLVICYPDGSHYGELTLVYEKGAPKSTYWDWHFQTEKDPTVLKGKTPAEKLLDQFLQPLLANPTYLQDLLFTIDNGIDLIRPATKHGLISGRPLALVRTDIALKIYGGEELLYQDEEFTIQNQSVAQPSKGWPVSIGNDVWLEEGLVGYFAGATADTINYNQLLTKYVSDKPSAYIKDLGKANSTLPTISTTKPLSLTLLMDPLGCVQARMGLVPSKAITLPTEFVHDALHNIELVIHKRPVLHTRQIGLSKPATKSKNWQAHGPLGEIVPFVPLGKKAQHDKTPAIASDIRLILKPSEKVTTS